jgi:hypothetical protein
MTNPPDNPPRLSSLPDSEDSLGVGRMFRGASELPDEEVPRLRWRLRTSQRLRVMRPRLVARVALVVGMAFCTGGVVGAVVSPLLARRKSAVVAAPTPAIAPTPRHPKARTASASPTAPGLPDPIPGESAPAVPDEEPRSVPREPQQVVASARPRSGATSAVTTEIEPPVVEPPPVERTPVEPPPVERPPVVSPLVVSSPIAVEQALLGQAIRTLRDGHDAGTALALLAQYAGRFPGGAFASEATVLRIEALLALGRGHEALVLLDGVSLASLPNQDEQRVVRGELRAADRRWREAAQDFDDALRGRDLPTTSPRARSLQERALWGRAAARSRLGDEAGARADLELYLRDFPAGRFSAAAASLLRGAP